MEEEIRLGNESTILHSSIILEKKDKPLVKNNGKPGDSSIMIDVVLMMLCKTI